MVKLGYEAAAAQTTMEYYDYSFSENYTYDTNATYDIQMEFNIKHASKCFEEFTCGFLVLLDTVIFLLGVCGNGLVIWIAGFRMKKTVNTTWYLSLAISDMLFCIFLPFNIVHAAMDDWIFGRHMCKFTSFAMFLNMFSSIFLLVIISVDRCVSVMFPVLAQNQRTISKAIVVVILAWVGSIVLSIPSGYYRDIVKHLGTTTCFNNYTSDKHGHKSVALSRFIGGFALPFLIIIICYSAIILRLRNNRMAKSNKPFKVMSALIAAFFFCWLPYHVLILVELNQHSYSPEVMRVGLKLGTSVAAANSFMNPVLYVFMGSDFKQKFRSSVLSKVENAMGEDGRTISRYLSRSSSMDGRASSHI